MMVTMVLFNEYFSLNTKAKGKSKFMFVKFPETQVKTSLHPHHTKEIILYFCHRYMLTLSLTLS